MPKTTADRTRRQTARRSCRPAPTVTVNFATGDDSVARLAREAKKGGDVR